MVVAPVLHLVARCKSGCVVGWSTSRVPQLITWNQDSWRREAKGSGYVVTVETDLPVSVDVNYQHR